MSCHLGDRIALDRMTFFFLGLGWGQLLLRGSRHVCRLELEDGDFDWLFF